VIQIISGRANVIQITIFNVTSNVILLLFKRNLPDINTIDSIPYYAEYGKKNKILNNNNMQYKSINVQMIKLIP